MNEGLIGQALRVVGLNSPPISVFMTLRLLLFKRPDLFDQIGCLGKILGVFILLLLSDLDKGSLVHRVEFNPQVLHLLNGPGLGVAVGLALPAKHLHSRIGEDFLEVWRQFVEPGAVHPDRLGVKLVICEADVTGGFIEFEPEGVGDRALRSVHNSCLESGVHLCIGNGCRISSHQSE